MPQRRRRRLAIFVLLIGLVVWLSGIAALTAAGSRPLPAGQWDAIVVAGCGVWPGGRPSPSLARRTRLAVALWRQGRAPRVCFTGGVGHYPPAESAVAAAYARRLGLPDQASLGEDRSTSTETNATEAARLLGPVRVLVVTDTFHVFRCGRVFARHFMAAQAVGSRPDAGAWLRGATRELAAVAWYALSGRLTAAAPPRTAGPPPPPSR